MVDQKKDYVALVILFLISLLNNIDRFTVAAVLADIQHYYGISDSMGGLIQTVFLVAYMISSPLCGYLGDRYSRKYVIMLGMFIWLSSVFASTWIPSNMFWLFLVFRGLFGCGEAGYANLSPSIIADLFTEKIRTRMYMIYYLGIPVGSGLGFIIGSNMANLLGSWQWGVRCTGVAGIIIYFLLIFFVYEPERGQAETVKEGVTSNTTYIQDLKIIATTPTYVIVTCAYTLLVFVTGTMTWWFPTILQHSESWRLGLNSTDELPKSDKTRIGFVFGAVASGGGLVGVLVGSIIAQALINGWGIVRYIQTPRANPLVSGIGALLSVPLFLVVILWGHNSSVLNYIILFTIVTLLSFNWSLNVETVNGVVLPCRRSTAFSYMILCSHLFGDASGPYIIGAVSDAILKGKPEPYSPEDEYKSLMKAVSICLALLLASAFFYFVATITYLRDNKKFKKNLGMNENGTDIEKEKNSDEVTWNSTESDNSCYKREESIASFSGLSQHF